MKKLLIVVGLVLIILVGGFIYFQETQSEISLDSESLNEINKYTGEINLVTYGSNWENIYYGNGRNTFTSGVSNVLTNEGYKPFNEVMNIDREGRFIKLSGYDYNITLDWGIIQKNGIYRDSQWILNNYPNTKNKLILRKSRDFFEWDFEINVTNIPLIVRQNVRGFYFELNSVEGNISYNDVSLITKTDTCSQTYNDEECNNLSWKVIKIKDTELSFEKEIRKGIDITINKTHIIYNNITNAIVDGVFTSDPVYSNTVIASSDDATRYFASSFTTTQAGARMGATSSDGYDIGARFLTITIPQGAIINSATYSWKNRATETKDIRMTASADDTDNAITFSTHADYVGRSRTTANTDYNPGSIDYVNGVYYDIDVTSAVQEVIDRVSWSSENALVILLDGNTNNDAYVTTNTYDDSSAFAPRIEIDYTSNPCSEGICIINSNYLLADVQLETGFASPPEATAGQMKWNVTDLCDKITSEDNITSAFLQLFIYTKGGSPDNDFRIRYIRDQTWNESTSAATFSIQPTYNVVNVIMSSTTQDTFTNVSIITSIKQACSREEFLSFRFEDPDNTLGSVDGVSLGKTIMIGDDNLFSPPDAFYKFTTREGDEILNQPKLFIEYEFESEPPEDTTPPIITINSATSDNEITVDVGIFFYEWDGDETLDACWISIDGTNFTGEFDGTSNCNYTATGQSNGNYTIYLWANDTAGNEGVSSEHWTNVSIAVTPNIIFNDTFTKSNFAIDGHSQGLNWTYYWETDYGTASGCTLSFNATNYSGTPSGNECSRNIVFDSGGGEQVNIIGYIEVGGINYSSPTNTTTIWKTNATIDGLWVWRAPVNAEDQGIGNSYARRGGVNLGNGQDIGVMWRADTLDDEGSDSNEFDEERHCGGWGHHFFDEPNISEGIITSQYCRIWIYSSALGGQLQGWAGNETNEHYDSFTYYPDNGVNIAGLYANPGEVNYYNFLIDYRTDLNVNFTSQGHFYNISYKVGGENIQMIDYQSQKSFCLINLPDNQTLNNTDSDGDTLSDWLELFVLYSDPYQVDTDKDGHSDLQEYNNGKNLWDPYDWGNITIYKANESSTYITYEQSLNLLSEPTAQSQIVTLSNTMSQSQKDNLTFFDQEYTTLTNIISSNENWRDQQINFRTTITEDENSLSNLVIFTGGKTGRTGSPTNESIEYKINNYAGGGTDWDIPGKKGTTSALFIKVFNDKDEIKDAISLLNRVETSYYHKVYRDGGVVTMTADQDFYELWTVTSGSFMTPITPTELIPLSTTNESTETIEFNFTEDGVEIIAGLTITNITIDGEECVISGIATYSGGNWNQDCVTPNKTDGSYNLVITANTSSSGDVELIILGGVDYVSDTCTYSGSGNWLIQCSDNCVIETAFNLLGNNLLINGSGFTIFNSLPYNFAKVYSRSISPSERCLIRVFV